MIHSLTGWRYVFAVVIFLHHYLIDGKSALQAGGTIGVTFFFILSGFLLAYGYKERLLAREISFASFWKSRAIKLYPLHILCFAAIFLFSIRSFTVTDLPKAVLNLFLLQSWVPLSEYYMSYNAVSWFLSDELFFYLMFPFVLPLLLNTSGRKITIGVGIFAILYATAVLLIPLDHYHAYFYINPLFRFADFVFGILIFRLFDRRKQVAVGHVFWAEAGAILMIFVTFLLFDYIPKPYHYCSVIFWVPIAILVYVFASTSLSVNYPHHALHLPSPHVHTTYYSNQRNFAAEMYSSKPGGKVSFRRYCPVMLCGCSVKPVSAFILFINHLFWSDELSRPKLDSIQTTCWPCSFFLY